MGFQHPPRLFLRSDSENAQKMLGKTAHYDPQEKAVTLFTHNRHPKDILRSYAHELVHHTQNLRGDLSPEKCGEMGQGYAQANGHMREMEREAYEKGNMCFRDWEDTLNDKDTYIIIKIAESKNLKENKSMTTKITKEFLKETIRRVLSERVQMPSAEEIKQAQMIIKGFEAGGDAIDFKNNKQYRDAQAVIARSKIKLKFSADLTMNQRANSIYKQLVDGEANVQQQSEIAAARIKQSGAQKGPDGNYTVSDEGNKKDDLMYALAAQAAIATFQRADTAAPAQIPQINAGPVQSIPPQVGTPNPAQGTAAVAPSAGGTPSLGVQSTQGQGSSAATSAATGGVSNARVKRRGVSQERLLKRLKPYMMEKISDLQRTLMYLGYLAPTQDNGQPSDDGKYGRQTMGAVMKLQKAAGMPRNKRDGVLGNDTLRSIDVNSELHKKLKASEQEAKLAGLPGMSGDAGSIPGVDQERDLSDEELRALKEKKAKPDYIDIDGDGNRKESMKKAAADKKKKKKKKTNETKIQTPEQENSLYESRFADRNNRLFENLSKKWTK